MKNRATYHLIIIVFLSIGMIGCSSHAPSKPDSTSKNLVDLTHGSVDSIPLDFSFNLDRWNICDSVLWITDARQDPFLTGVSINSFQKIYQGGKLGQGPEDFICPGIVEGSTNGPIIYSNVDNKIITYQLVDKVLHPVKQGKFPLLEKGGTLPNSYTRVAFISDSIFAGTYFNPRQVGVDIIDPTKGTLLSTLPLPFEQTGKTLSIPYEMKVATSDSSLVTAYRYMDLIEFYSVDGTGNATVYKSIGNADNPQNDVIENEDYDNIIKYYSDIACVDGKVYLLYQGTVESRLSDCSTALHIYSLLTGENLMNISLGRYFDQLAVSQYNGTIYLYTPDNEDYLFKIPIPNNY